MNENLCLNNNYLSREQSYLFDSSIFKKIDKKNFKFNYDTFELIKTGETEFAFDLGDGLVLRPLRIVDFERGYLQLLEQACIFSLLLIELDLMYDTAYFWFLAHDCWRRCDKGEIRDEIRRDAVLSEYVLYNCD